MPRSVASGAGRLHIRAHHEKGSQVARWLNTSRRRLGAVSAGVVLAAAAAGCTPSVSGGPGDATTDSVSSQDEIIVVCESGTVTQDGIETSSSVAMRLPAGSPIPEGCRLA